MNNDVKHKLYRDLEPGETLQAGDLWRVICDEDMDWTAISADEIADAAGTVVTSVEESGIEYRRPVDAVPREEYDKLKQALAEADALLGEAVRGAVQVNEELRHAAIFGKELSAVSQMLNFVIDHMQIASAQMNGQHLWRWCHGWPMTHAIGPSPQDAIRAAMAECEKNKLPEAGQ